MWIHSRSFPIGDTPYKHIRERDDVARRFLSASSSIHQFGVAPSRRWLSYALGVYRSVAGATDTLCFVYFTRVRIVFQSVRASWIRTGGPGADGPPMAWRGVLYVGATDLDDLRILLLLSEDQYDKSKAPSTLRVPYTVPFDLDWLMEDRTFTKCIILIRWFLKLGQGYRIHFIGIETQFIFFHNSFKLHFIVSTDANRDFEWIVE